MLILSLIFAHALAAEPLDCKRTTPLDKTADVIESKAREKNGELCAAAGKSASVEDQSKLLGLIRDRAVSRLDRVKPTDFDAKGMRDGHANLRALQALRQSQLVDSPEGLRLSPAVALKGLPGLPPPETLRPSDVGLVQRAYEHDIETINAKLTDTSGAERRRLISQLATPLQARIRDAGEVGYFEAVSAHPELLFAPSAAPSDDDLKKAHGKYFEEVRKQVEKMRTIDPSPAGDALGLVFFGPAAKETLKEHPELCGSYQALLERARQSEKFRALLNAGAGLAAGGTCLASGVVSAGALTAACFALTLGEFGVASVSAAASYRELEVLYGGLMQGASVSDYEKKHQESQNYLLAAGLSGAGAAGAVGGVRSALIAAERETVIQNAHLIGKGEIGRDGTAARVGNYTRDQIRRKIAELKKSRHIGLEERKELVRSGRVGLDDPAAINVAEDQLAILKTIDRDHLGADALALLERRLNACVNSSIRCKETYAAITEAFEKETKNYGPKIDELQQRLRGKAEETTDETHFDRLAETLTNLSACRENPASPACREAMIEAERHTKAPPYALQGPAPVSRPPVDSVPAAEPSLVPKPSAAPAPRKTLSLTPQTLKTVSSNKALQAKPNPVRPWQSSALPIDEVDNLKFLTPQDRILLRQRLTKTLSDDGVRARRYALEKSENKADYTPVEDLNATLQSILGDHVVVTANETKVMLTSNARQIQVVLDPTTRYFTVKNLATRSGREEYLMMEKSETGQLRYIRVLPEGGRFATYSHFGY